MTACPLAERLRPWSRRPEEERSPATARQLAPASHWSPHKREVAHPPPTARPRTPAPLPPTTARRRTPAPLRCHSTPRRSAGRRHCPAHDLHPTLHRWLARGGNPGRPCHPTGPRPGKLRGRPGRPCHPIGVQSSSQRGIPGRRRRRRPDGVTRAQVPSSISAYLFHRRKPTVGTVSVDQG